MKRETFRAVLTTGKVQLITVALGSDGWAEVSFEGHHDTARDAAMGYAIGFGLPLAELRGEGEQTTAERVAVAVTAETKRCVLECEAIASYCDTGGVDGISEAHRREGARACLAAIDPKGVHRAG